MVCVLDMNRKKEKENTDYHPNIIYSALLLVQDVCCVYSMADSFIPSSMPSSTVRRSPLITTVYETHNPLSSPGGLSHCFLNHPALSSSSTS